LAARAALPPRNKKSPSGKEDDDSLRLPNAPSAVQTRVPNFRSVVARNVAAISLRDRRRRPSCVFVARSASLRRSKLVAGFAVGSNGLRQLALPGIILVRRQRTDRQSRLFDRRWIAQRRGLRRRAHASQRRS